MLRNEEGIMSRDQSTPLSEGLKTFNQLVTPQAPPASAPRRCAQCNGTAVCVEQAIHMRYGRPTGQSTDSYSCQSCSARFTIRPRSRVMAFKIVGVMLGLPAFLLLLWGCLMFLSAPHSLKAYAIIFTSMLLLVPSAVCWLLGVSSSRSAQRNPPVLALEKSVG